MTAKSSRREQRLAEALRANLKRRKQAGQGTAPGQRGQQTESPEGLSPEPSPSAGATSERQTGTGED